MEELEKFGVTMEQIAVFIADTKPYLIYEIIKQTKPYLSEIENHVQQIPHGTIDLKLTVHGNVVEKIEFIEHKTWVRQKNT